MQHSLLRNNQSLISNFFGPSLSPSVAIQSLFLLIYTSLYPRIEFVQSKRGKVRLGAWSRGSASPGDSPRIVRQMHSQSILFLNKRCINRPPPEHVLQKQTSETPYLAPSRYQNQDLITE